MICKLKCSVILILLFIISGCEPGKPIHTSDTYYNNVLISEYTTSFIDKTDSAGGTLFLASPILLDELDVHLSASPGLASWGPGLAYSRLLRFRSGYDVSSPTMATECDLCEHWEQIDLTTYMFKIRQDAYWHDIDPVSGRRVVVRDIIESFQRQMSSGHPNATLINDIHTMESVGNGNLKITIKEPNADFISNIANGFSKIVASETIENGKVNAESFAGSGPWVWSRDKAGTGHYFSANNNYYEPDLPYAERLSIQVIGDSETRLAAFLVGKIDILEPDVNQLRNINLHSDGLVTLDQMEFGSGLELSINTSTKPLDQIKVRQAIFQSMDPWMAIEDMWLGLGFVSVGIPLFDQDWILPEQDLRNYFGSRELAIDLMNDLASDSTNYVKLSVAHYSDAHLNYGEKIAQSMEDIGFTVDVNTLNIEQYEEVWHSGEYQILIGPAIPVSGTNSYLNAVLHSDGKANTSHHRDQYLDRLIEKQSKTTDLLLRKKLLGDIQRHVIDRAIKFMPVSKVSRWVYWPRVNNFTPNFAGGEYFYLSKVWVADN